MLNITEYIEISEDIIKEIVSLPACQRYKQLQQKMLSNPEIIKLISEFEQAKAVFKEVEQYGAKYHPDYKGASSRLIEAKTQLYQHPDIIEFKLCEKEVQEILNQITLCMRGVIKFETNTRGLSSGCKGRSCSS